MRPAHQPPVRLAQLAAILTRYTGWFTTLIESDNPGPVLRTLDVKGLGAQTKYSILINAHIPFLYAYSAMRQETHNGTRPSVGFMNSRRKITESSAAGAGWGCPLRPPPTRRRCWN